MSDQAAHGSPAHEQLGAFQQAYEQDPNLLAEQVRERRAARAAAAELAARGAA